MRTWSVETESNSWNDDEFNGTFDECIDYCNKKEYIIDGKFARLVEIEIDERGCVVDCYDIVNEL